MHNIILVCTAMAAALIGGLFYAYSCSVNPGLGRLGDKEYIVAMQSINIAIINPLFLLSFIGTFFLLPLCTWMQYSSPPTDRFYLLLAATLLYGIGVFGVTFMGNVPLNNALASMNPEQLSAQALLEQRSRFEAPWNSLNRVRSICSALSIFCVIVACIADQYQLRNLFR
jgi:uncharacterized membrane protein